MLDVSPPPNYQRTRGIARVTIGRGGLQDLHQSGSAKAMLPRIHGPVPEVVFLNTSGGMTGGDHLTFDLAIGDGAHVLATTQTAERAYGATDDSPPAQMEIDLTLGAEATLDWLPQETIIFDHAHLSRRTRVEMAGTARLTMVETVVLGRAAMGETLAQLKFRDLRDVRRGGAPIWVDPFGLDCAALADFGAAATGQGARVIATLAVIGPGAEDAAGPLRDLGPMPDVRMSVSGWDGRTILRALAGDSWPMRKALARCLTHLRGRALPRVWQM